MKNTIKALSKQFFGAKYESARKSLLAAVILFIAVYAPNSFLAQSMRAPEKACWLRLSCLSRSMLLNFGLRLHPLFSI